MENLILNLNKKSSFTLIKKLLISLGIILFFKFGSMIPVPGIIPRDLAMYYITKNVNIMALNIFNGQKNFTISIFELNIFPYLTASIGVQILITLSPTLSKLRKENELSNKRILNRLTRLFTLILAIYNSSIIAFDLKSILYNWDLGLFVQIVLWLTTGAMIVLWLTELITDYGLGNGVSIILFSNIVTNFPNIIEFLVTKFDSIIYSPIENIIIFISALLAMLGIIYIQESFRRIQLISSKQLSLNEWRDEPNKINTYIPLKINQAGVLPIIVTSGIFATLNRFVESDLISLSNVINLGIFPRILYWYCFFIFVLIFTRFYSSIVLSPKDIANQLQKVSATIPGIRPGNQTTYYLSRIINRLSFISSFSLAILAALPGLLQSVLKISIINGLSVSALLIITSVIIDILKEIEEIIFSNIYNNNKQIIEL